ncbi:MAG: ThiF family adenylyltransferase [Candidatus Eisenbacteria bacterium]|nr:ThiF family adenylyltransferase [Candidatus Eisenbacteria bacterium]
MTAAVHRQIIGAIGGKTPENGMLLGGDPVDGVVRHVVFDDGAVRSGSTYSPDHVRLNSLLSDWWRPSGIRLLGFVHSHPGQFARPSGGDLHYAKAILKANPHLDRLLMPIVTVTPEPMIHPFVVRRTAEGVTAAPATLEVLDEVLLTAGEKSPNVPAVELPVLPPRRIREETFQRVVCAYDLAHLRHCRVVVVGVGGAAGFAEDLVRAGVHDLVLIDPDTVSTSNLATQQVYRRDLGRSKVEAIADRLRDINPAVEVRALQADFTSLTESEVESLLGLDLARPPIRTLLCGCTDDFFAQARVNRVGLQHGVPTLCGQLYAEGRGAELTFTYPAVTPACHRCILRSRYEAYLEHRYANAVTSDGTPISSTTRLNAAKLAVAMGLLHHGTTHARWGRLLERIGNRNLVQLRLDPDLELPVFDQVLVGDRERVFSDEAVWLPQEPEGPAVGRPACPDCGGTGDLRQAIGTIADTRLLPPRKTV